ncbi:DUF2927 domain-containing protein [Neptunicoccus sediminis]|uniref:DUF2927 domain-containing protein n=1 Tax=Neptunicoccus sediminis TaxID=1892596 RepID=UPI000845EF66|nr:DUF2927 domain-containing protein [Neptunicoccus sediminis]
MNFWRGAAFGLSVMALSACAGPMADVVSKRSDPTVQLSGMKTFHAPPPAAGVARSNLDVFEEFLDLTFALESGQDLTKLSRFEGPITVALVNPTHQVVGQDLDRLIKRLQTEANIPISRVQTAAAANIVIEMVSKRQLRRAAPTAACIVVPRMSSWAEFRKNRFNRRADWTSLEVRSRAAVFMPRDISPQDARDCLHEELAQAIGPLNDLYRLPDSVFNDDNFHIVLTPYDMMILRAMYAPELHSGMAKHEVAAVLPRILARVNPQGAGLAPLHRQESPGSWVRKIEIALGPDASDKTRIEAAADAVRIAQQLGMTDHRLGFSYYARARVTAATNGVEAAADYARAYANFSKIFGPYDIHTAQAGLQMASLAMSSGEFRQALQFIESGLITAKTAQNGRLMFSLLAMKAEIYKLAGRTDEATALRTEAVAWGQYGIHPPSEINKRLDFIANLPPRLPQKES